MSKVKVSMICQIEELPAIYAALGGRQVSVSEYKPKLAAQPVMTPFTLDLVPGPADQLTYHVRDEVVKQTAGVATSFPKPRKVRSYKLDREKVLSWPSTTALLRAFQQTPICRRPDFEAALITAGYGGNSYSNIVWHLTVAGVIERIGVGAYRLIPEELRSGASE